MYIYKYVYIYMYIYTYTWLASSMRASLIWIHVIEYTYTYTHPMQHLVQFQAMACAVGVRAWGDGPASCRGPRRYVVHVAYRRADGRVVWRRLPLTFWTPHGAYAFSRRLWARHDRRHVDVEVHRLN
jgi:hypothetical protein